MPRWLWGAPLGLATLFASFLAFQEGMYVRSLTETDVISRYATRYVETYGGTAVQTDCAATPSREQWVWISVRCDLRPSYHVTYHVNRLGRLVTVETSLAQGSVT